MPRLFVGNFDFEHRLAAPRSVPSAKLQRLNAELVCSWLAIAETGDTILVPEAITPEFWSQLADQGLPRVHVVSQAMDCPHSNLTPWGWSAEIVASLAKRAQQNYPEISVVREVNSRRFSSALETEWDVALPGAADITTLVEAERAVAVCGETTGRWVIKAEFGMSGRERILGQGAITQEHRGWLARRLKQDGMVFVEPWVEAVAETGLQFEIADNGDVQFLGIAPMLPSRLGGYAGTCFTGSVPAEDWTSALSLATQAAHRIAAQGYFGPLGIDAMRYRRPDGTIGVRPLQDINARWTMGRLALGWRRIFSDARQGIWWHGTQTEYERGAWAETWQGLTKSSSPPQVIRTSPERIGAQPAWLASALVIASHT